VAETQSTTKNLTFRCVCGATFRVSSKHAGKQARCRFCREGIMIPRRSGETASKIAMPKTSDGKASTAIQPMCSVCQCPIEDDESVRKCPDCHLPFHEECWQENLGCSAYGCPQVNALKAGPDMRVSSVSSGAGPDTMSELSEAIWHYAIDGQILGTLQTSELVQYMQERRIGPDHMVWRDGMQNWQRIADVPQLGRIAQSGAAAPILDDSFPWELLLVAAASVAFLFGLVSYGIPPLVVLAGSVACLVGRIKKTRSGARAAWRTKNQLLLILSFAICLVGIVLGIVTGCLVR